MSIEWDDTLELSDKKYLSSEISTTIRQKFNDGKFEEMKLTAKEWILKEIRECKRRLEMEKSKFKDRKNLAPELRELKLLQKYYKKYISEATKWDIAMMGEIENIKEIETNIKKIEAMICQAIINKEEKENEIIKQHTEIKKICLENVKIILQKENIKDYSNGADTLLKINNINVGKNYRLPYKKLTKKY